MNKRLVGVLIGIFFTGFFLALVAGWRRPTAPPPPPGLDQNPAFASPGFPDLPIKRLDYVLPSPADFPDLLPRYTYGAAPAAEDLLGIARALGFTEAPQKLDDISGTVYLWTKTDRSMSLKSPATLSYSMSGNFDQMLPASIGEGVERISREFLSPIIPAEYTININSVRYLLAREDEPIYVTDPARANIAEVGVGLGLPDGRVYPPHAGTWTTLHINADLDITKAEATIPPRPQKTGGAMSVAPYALAATRLTSNAGVLVSYGAEGTNSYGYNPISVRVSKIESVDLGYYYTENNTEFMPVYRFYGVAVDTQSGEEIKTYTIVSALP